MTTKNKTLREIKYFHPSGKPMPNGSHIQRGGYMQECKANKEAYELDETVHGGENDNTKYKGGVVTLPINITKERHDEVFDMVREVVMAVEDQIRIQRRFFNLFKINMQEHVVAYSVSHSFRGKYIGVDGESYGGESFSVEVNGLSSWWFAIFAETLANYIQRDLLAKDLNSNKILMINKGIDPKIQLTELNAFRKGLRRIDETGVNRILQHGQRGFIIISANRNEIYSNIHDNDLTPLYEEWCEAHDREVEDKENLDLWLRNRNKIENTKLFERLKSSKYAYTPVYRGYNGQDGIIDDFEPSYIVYCHGKGNNGEFFDFNDLYEFGLELVKKFKQDSFYVSNPNEASIYVDGDGNKVNSKGNNNYEINRYTEEHFTTKNRKKRTTNDYHDNSGRGRIGTSPNRFTADILFENLYHNGGPSCYGDRVKRGHSGEIFINK